LLYNIQTCKLLSQPGDCVLLRFFSFVGRFVVNIGDRPFVSVFDPNMPWALSLDLRPAKHTKAEEEELLCKEEAKSNALL